MKNLNRRYYLKKQFLGLCNRSFLIALLLFSLKIYAQETSVSINSEGKGASELKYSWAAQWITHPTESTFDFGVFLLRRDFELVEKPDKFIIYVSGDNQYYLYVNGKQVCYGPASGDLNNYRYETIDIADFLIPGKNIISARLVNFGEYRKASIQSFQTAFILQNENFSDINLNTGTGNWKITRNPAYQDIAFTSAYMKAYYCAGPGEIFTANQHPWDWKEVDFDDSEWEKPKKATVEFAVGRGFLYGSTWFLVPRTIPFPKEEELAFREIINFDKDVSFNFLTKSKTIIIPKNTKISLLFDHGIHATGFPKLNYSKGANSEIKITYAEALYANQKLLEKNKSNLVSFDPKGNRNDFRDKEIFGYYDLIYPDGSDLRLYTPLARRTYRFAQLDIETKDQKLIINKFNTLYSTYPFEEKAKFITTDKSINDIWETAWRTIVNSGPETFIDPYYEQLQYVGDTRIEALVSIYVSGDDRLMRKAIKQFDDSRLPIGLTQSRYPSYIVQIIPPYSLLWIGMIHDYYMYRDDPEFLKQFLPGMKSVLEWFELRIDDTGMLGELEWWNFTDWAKGFNNGIPPGADNGNSANISLQLVKALQDASEIFEYFGEIYNAEKYSKLAESIRIEVKNRCYNKEKGLIAETPKQEIFSQHTNIFSILTNTTTPSEHADVMNKILTEPDLIQSTLYFKFYLFRALQKAGMGEQYLDLLYPWENMVTLGMTTFGEKDDMPRSECHGWSASPCFDLLHTVGGIYPKTPGFKEVIIEPNFGKLNKLDIIFPHPAGSIIMQIEKNSKGKISGNIQLPSGIKGEFRYKNSIIKLNTGMQKINI